MTNPARWGRVLVIAPHPDDEILGCGGTMARVADAGGEVFAAIVTRGQEPAFPRTLVEQVMAEAAEAHRIIGTRHVFELGLPAAALGSVAAAELNAHFQALMDEVRPDTLFLPFAGDIHVDHQLSFLSGLVAARPRRREVPRHIYAYETLSETNWYAPGITPAFVPQVYVDVSETLERKLSAFRAFRSQVKDFPDERSIEAIEALARLRGATVYRPAAEAFMLVREII